MYYFNKKLYLSPFPLPIVVIGGCLCLLFRVVVISCSRQLSVCPFPQVHQKTVMLEEIGANNWLLEVNFQVYRRHNPRPRVSVLAPKPGVQKGQYFLLLASAAIRICPLRY